MHFTVLPTNQPHVPLSSAPNQSTERHTGAQSHQLLVAQHAFTVPASIYTLIENWLDIQSFTYFSTVNKTCAQRDQDMWAKRFRVYAAKDPRVLDLTSSVTNPARFKNLYFQFERLKFSNETNFFRNAIREGCTEVVSLLIERYPKIVDNSSFLSSLEIAVQMQHLNIVRMLISYSSQEAQEQTISYAVDKGDRDSVGILLSENKKLALKVELLFCAIYKCNANIVELLLDHKADVESPCHYHHFLSRCIDPEVAPPLRYTIQNLHEYQTDGRVVDIVQTLLEHKANLNPMGDFPTALMCAAQSGNRIIINLLLRHARKTIGIPTVIQATDWEGRTALQFAIRLRNQEIVELLMSHKASIHQTDHEGRTGLMHALYSKRAASESDANFLRFLLARKAEVNHVDNQGQTPLMHAVQSTSTFDWSPDFTEILLAHKADVNMLDKNGKTALIHASIGEVPTAGIQLLLDHRADVSIADHEDMTALMYAQIGRQKEDQLRILQAAQAAVASAAT